MQKTWLVIGWLAPLALMLVLVTTNVRLVANSLTVYDTLFGRYRVSERTAITPEGLRSVGQQIQNYFNSDTEPLRVVADIDGVERELFGADEVSHMADVKRLFRRTYRAQELSALLLVAAIVTLAATRPGSAARVVGRWFVRGSVLTVAVIGLLGLVSLVAFGPLFTLFHYIGFPQGNWTFDSTDYLIRIFPFGFWRDVTILIGALTIMEAAILGVAGHLIPRVLDRLAAQRGAPPAPIAADHPARS